MLAHLPEMEVHASGKDGEDHKLETVSSSIVSRNRQQDVEVHTHATWSGRSTKVWNINDFNIQGIREIHTPGGAAM
jgi:hypothetical protein